MANHDLEASGLGILFCICLKNEFGAQSCTNS